MIKSDLRSNSGMTCVRDRYSINTETYGGLFENSNSQSEKQKVYFNHRRNSMLLKKHAATSKKKRSGELALGAAPTSSGSDGVDAQQRDDLSTQAQSTALLFPSSN